MNDTVSEKEQDCNFPPIIEGPPICLKQIRKFANGKLIELVF